MSTSIAMATYNGASYLRQQLDSLAAQQRLPDELVITDDFSTDATPAIIEAFAASAPFPVRFFPNDHRLGVRDNFQRALSLTIGQIVLMSDQDDAWLPSKIARVAKLLEENPTTLVVMNDKIIADDQLRPSNTTMLSNIRNYGAPSSLFVAGCCSAIRRDWLEVALPIPEGIAWHDVWIVGLAYDLDVVQLCEEPLQYYRRHDSNVSQGPYSANRKLTLKDRVLAEMALLTQKNLESQKEQWQVEQRWAFAKADRLRSRQAHFRTLGLDEKAIVVAARLKRRAELLEERCRNASSGRVRRITRGVNLWRRGGYGEFAGWKSLVKDLTLR
jgi:glycosyltransferase involved in cell wall biosynthesis